MIREDPRCTGIREHSGPGWDVGPMRLLVSLLVWVLRAVFPSRCSPALENQALRQQLAAHIRTQKRPRLKPGERAFCVALSMVWRHDYRLAARTTQVSSTSRALLLGRQVRAVCRSDLIRSDRSATGPSARPWPERSSMLVCPFQSRHRVLAEYGVRSEVVIGRIVFGVTSPASRSRRRARSMRTGSA